MATAVFLLLVCLLFSGVRACVDECVRVCVCSVTGLSKISGIKSEGIICDGPMLGWKATKGIAVHVPDSFDPGDTPPRTKPKE